MARSADVTDGTERHEAYRVTRDGALLGRCVGDRALVWYGVPYAAPPVGERRWRAPASPLPWRGVRDATQPPAPACQVLSYSTPDKRSREGRVVGDEDCLYLTIWSPRSAPTGSSATGKLPVLIWFHGGGNMIGDGADFDASRLSTSQNVVVISVNHRLNILGWLAHRALRDPEAGAEGHSGNFAVLDHIAALGWVRDNVAAFGGDAERVTLVGHSGGGWNVRALLCSPPARGLFHRAIVQSVGAYQLMTLGHSENFLADDPAGHPLSSGELLLSLLLADGRASEPKAAMAQIRATPDAELAAYLRRQPYEALSRAVAATSRRNAAASSAEALTRHSARRLPQMFADGVVLTGEVQSRVPIMVGTTRYEDRTFLSADRRFVANLHGHPVIRDPERYAILSDYLGSFYAAHGVAEPAEAWVRQGLPVYAYRCDWDDVVSPPWLDFRAMIGAGHGSELPLVFGTTDLGAEYAFQHHLYDGADDSSFRRTSAAVMDYWGAFARDGAPARGTCGTLPMWREWRDHGVMVLDGEAGGGLRMSRASASRGDVIEQIRVDARLPPGPLRQRLIRDLKDHAITQLDAADYARLAD